MNNSNPEKPVIGRPNHKQRSVTDDLRSQIVEGKLKPGDQLPTRPQLMDFYEVSSVTIQRSLDQLVEEGYVAARPRLGTFVNPHPPHLSCYALTFPRVPEADVEENTWPFSRFWTALAQQGVRMSEPEGPRFRIYSGVNGHSDSEGHIRLMRDMEARRVAGVIFIDPYLYAGLIAQSPVPCVAFMDQPGLPGLLSIQVDLEQIIDRALDDLASKGRKRIGFLLSEMTQERQVKYLLKAVAARGMETQEGWTIGLSLARSRWASNAVQAMMMQPAERRPDGLVITDDHLVLPAVEGLSRVGVTPGLEIDVVGHSNHGWSPTPAGAVRQLGYVARDLLLQAVELINTANTTGKAPRMVRMKPLFAEEARLDDASPASLGMQSASANALPYANASRM